MTADEARSMHDALCSTIRADRVRGVPIYLAFNAPLTPEEAVEAGWYNPVFNGAVAKIQVWRFRSTEPNDGDFERELVTLAQEHGHAISDQRGERPWPQMPLPSPDLSPSDKAAIQAEEARAWNYGREVLAGLGMTDWRAFEDAKRWSDNEYRRRLGL